MSRRGAGVLAGALAVVLVALGVGAGVSSRGSGSAGLMASPEALATVASTCGREHRARARYAHVIWIWLENHSFDSVIGSRAAPFTNRLAESCGLATNYHNVTHPSLPNYIAATSGGTQGITSDCQPQECSRDVPSVFGQVAAAGMTWASYQESMPGTCDLDEGSGSRPDGDYAPRHDPAVYFLPLRPDCHRRVVPLGLPASGALAHALESDALPAFSFVTPNLCNDTHDCPVASGDAWLARWLPRIVASPAYRTGGTVIFVTWDEGEGGSSGDCSLNTSDVGCHVATLVVSPSTPRGTRSGELYNHYSLLKTTEQLLGIGRYLGHANDTGTNSMRPAFRL
ncbi:MAG: phosphatidylinositol-3-phosphatase [Gaiellales bacterium]|nr:phosphatidylinositol-3-phosphatase [Gaiellales bacterium]